MQEGLTESGAVKEGLLINIHNGAMKQYYYNVIKYVDDKCNTEYIIETYSGHFYECKPTTKSIDKQVNKD